MSFSSQTKNFDSFSVCQNTGPIMRVQVTSISSSTGCAFLSITLLGCKINFGVTLLRQILGLDYSADDLYNKLAREGNHMKYLETIPKKQVTKCLNMLLNKETENGKGNSKGNNEDLNKLNDDDLNAVKAKMNESFEKNRIKPGDNDWKYDVEEDFETGVKIESGWDGDDQSDLEF